MPSPTRLSLFLPVVPGAALDLRARFPLLRSTYHMAGDYRNAMRHTPRIATRKTTRPMPRARSVAGNQKGRTVKIESESITNDNIMTTDFARQERISFLRSIKPTRSLKRGYLAPGLPAHGVWMTDVSAMDRRSVKAQLAGRGDYRVWWWQLHCLIHRLFRPQATLEHTMFTFHRRHHALTLASLQLWCDYRQVCQAIRVAGVLAGWRTAIVQSQSHEGEQQ